MVYWQWTPQGSFPFTWDEGREVERVRSPFDVEDGTLYHLEGGSSFCFWGPHRAGVKAVLDLAEGAGVKVSRRARTVLTS